MDAPWIPSGFICYIRSISFITYIRLIYVVLPFPTSWIPSASICYTISISTTSICSICFPVPWISTDSIYFYDLQRFINHSFTISSLSLDEVQKLIRYVYFVCVLLSKTERGKRKREEQSFVDATVRHAFPDRRRIGLSLS